MIHSIKEFSNDRLGKHLTFCGKRIKLKNNSSAVVGEITCSTCRRVVAENKIDDLNNKIGFIDVALKKLDEGSTSYDRLVSEKFKHEKEVKRLKSLI